MTACVVCRAPATDPFVTVDGRDYRRCGTCAATFLEPAQRLSLAAECAHYDQHRNAVGDPGYRRFLNRLASPLLAVLAPGSSGLDYGCGPGPALAAMLEEQGHRVAVYDPYFHPDQAALNGSYDFITCSEVVEHFHDPAAEFDRLGRLLRSGGVLAVMTCFQSDDDRFAAWHYRRDPTHVVFYRVETLRHIAVDRGWKCEVPVKDVALMWTGGDPDGQPPA